MSSSLSVAESGAFRRNHESVSLPDEGPSTALADSLVIVAVARLPTTGPPPVQGHRHVGRTLAMGAI